MKLSLFKTQGVQVKSVCLPDSERVGAAAETQSLSINVCINKSGGFSRQTQAIPRSSIQMTK